MTSQLEFYRYSKEIAGNLANVVTQYQFLQKYICHERSCRNGGTQIPTFGHAYEAAYDSIPKNPL